VHGGIIYDRPRDAAVGRGTSTMHFPTHFSCDKIHDMKTLVKLGAVLMVLLLALAACTFDQISVRWSVDNTVGPGPIITVDYTVWNDGKYDLTGVNLEIGIDSSVGIISYWTPDFSLDRGETKYGTFSFSIGSATPVGVGLILGVDMDKPKDS
jgi:hypothetical protein